MMSASEYTHQVHEADEPRGLHRHRRSTGSAAHRSRFLCDCPAKKLQEYKMLVEWKVRIADNEASASVRKTLAAFTPKMYATNKINPHDTEG